MTEVKTDVKTEPESKIRKPLMQIRSKPKFLKRKRACPFKGPEAPVIDYKDTRVLQKFVSDAGKILPTRITSVSTKSQRALTLAIKRARFLALMPYIAE